MTPLIRPAKLADAPSIAQVNVESWRTTYKGIMPDELLANQSVERRETMWSGVLSNPDSRTFLFVAEVDGQVIGFAAAGPERTEHPIYKGELYAIYLLADHQGRGIGRALAKAVVHRLLEKGYDTMLIWVAFQNPATHFYEALGGHRVASKREAFGGTIIEEIAYGYDDIRRLVENDSPRIPGAGK
jgi:GNAT superfamily N-acetyltransferase